MTASDELCGHCAAIPLYDLFTGPRLAMLQVDEQDGVEHAAIGTLDQVWTNANCPLCRMVKHCLEGGEEMDANILEQVSDICAPSDIEVRLWPERVDRADETVFQSHKTDELLATRLAVRLKGLPHIAQEARDKLIKYSYPSAGIQLLSPDSIDPTRPLRNGFLAPSADDSLGLLRTWIHECKEHHRHTTCHPLKAMPGSSILPAHIRAIDIASRALVEIDPAVSQYATLSYVWGDSTASYADVVDSLGDSSTPRLPATVPQLILDAIAVCTVLAIPYLWVDLYCIHQTDPALKAIEIALMGQIYRSSLITLVAGSPKHRTLLPPPDTPAHQQLLFTTASTAPPRKLTLITQPPPLLRQLSLSPWTTRSWTFQEGHLAPRLAFFNPPYPLSFVCNSGLFSPTLHSGPYGHACHLPPLELNCYIYNLVSGRQWLATSEWSFADYAIIVSFYSIRELSFESDKLNALGGCLTAIGQRKGVEFLWGMPTAEFHYSLLWTGEDGERRDGFPSWCWAGWVNKRNRFRKSRKSPTDFFLLPRRPSEQKWLGKGGGGSWEWEAIEGESEVTPSAFVDIAELKKNDGRLTRYQERLAGIRVTGPKHEKVIIDSEGVRVWVEFRSGRPSGTLSCPGVCCEVLRDAGVGVLEKERMYDVGVGKCGVYLRDGAGNLHHGTLSGLRWLRWPMLAVWLPDRLRGKDLRWLMEDGLELVKIADVELGLRGDEAEPVRHEPVRHVLCLGVDRTWNKGVEGRGRRMGMFVLTGDMWEKAGPEKMVVELE